MSRWWYSEIVRSARLSVPPARALALVGLVYLVFEYLSRLADSGNALVVPPQPNFAQLVQSRWIDFAAAAFGVYRVLAFHPYVRVAYRNWLKTTCWRSGKPLPLGPVTLTLTDGVLLGAGMGLAWHANPFAAPLAVPCLFAAAYVCVVSLTLLLEGPRTFAYAILFAAGAMLLYGTHLEIVCAIAVGTYVLAWFGLRRSLARLPVHEPGPIKTLFAPTDSLVDRAMIRPGIAGWPFGYLCPRRSLLELPRFDAVCISLLAGWLVFCLTMIAMEASRNGTLETEYGNNIAVVALPVCAGVCVGRMLVYRVIHHPPINLFGRFATGRWLIPSYDRAFVAPFAGLCVLALLLPRFIGINAHPSAVEIPIVVTAVFLVTLVPGPSYRNWILTSECRIVGLKPEQFAARR